MLRQRIFDFGRIDVFAAADDHVLQTIGDEDEAVLVHVGTVTGMHPAVFECGCGLLGLVPVALHHIRAPHDHLAHRAARHLAPLGVDDAHLAAKARPASCAQLAELAALGGMRPGRIDGCQRRELGHAVGLHEAHPGQRGHGPLDHCFRHRGGAIGDGVQCTQVARLLHRRMVDHHLDHGRHQQHMGDPVAGHDVEHPFGVEARHDRMRIAFDPVRHRHAHVGQMEHRRGMQIGAVGGGQTIGAHRQARAAQIGVAEHHPLGKTGGAAGVENAGQVVASPDCIRDRCRGSNQRLVIMGAGGCLRVAAIDHLAQGLRIAAQPLDHRAEVLVDQQQGRARIVKRIDDLGG